MKAKVFGLFIAILGLLLAVGPIYIVPPCVKMLTTLSGAEIPMKCFWSARAELGIGILISVGGILTMFFTSAKARLAISLMIFFTSLLALAIPAHLIGGCKMETMACQLTTFPFIYVLSSVIALVCLVNIFYLVHKAKTENY